MRGFRIAMIFGIPIEINVSWIIIFAILLWSLSAGIFPESYPGLSSSDYWIMGLATTLLFFASLIAHELSHSVVSQHYGLKVRRIVLFVFGGISETTQELPNPKVEFLVAIAGPGMSFLLAGLFAIASHEILMIPGWLPASAVCAWLSIVNLALGIFNLVPGFPLDGGRVFRAAAWKFTGSYEKATRLASRGGQAVGIALIVWGVFRLFDGDLLGAIWLGLLGTLLFQAAASQYGEVLMAHAFTRLHVSDLMSANPMILPPNLSLQEVIDQYLLRHPYGGYPVSDDHLEGLLQTQHGGEIPPEERPRLRVSQVMLPLSADQALDRNNTITEALQRFSELNVGRLPVVDHGTVVGILSQSDVVRWLAWHPTLEDDHPT